MEGERTSEMEGTEVEARIPKGKIGYVDRHGAVQIFDTPQEVAEFKEAENDPSNR